MATTGDTVTLLFSCLSTRATTQLIETYISAKVDDDDLEIIKVKLLPNCTACAVIKGMTDVNGFINQRHKIGDSFSEVSLAEPEPPSNDQDISEDDDNDSTSPRSDIIPNLIEVISDKSIDTEILEMYFGGKRSGGKIEKEIESVEEIEDRVYHIKFECEQDAALVVGQAKHVCGRTKCSVRYVLAPVPKEYDKNKLIVRDIPDNVDEEFFSTLIESRLGLEYEEDFTVDFRKKCAIVIFSKDYTDKELDERMQKLTKKKIRKQQICVERCEVNCSIIIQNITKTTFANEDGLEMYFEQRRSGGGEDVVESVVMLGDSSAKITFVNPSVVDQVLKCTSYHLKKLGTGVKLSVCTPLDSFEEPQDSNSSFDENSQKSTSSEEENIQASKKTPPSEKKRKKSKSKRHGSRGKPKVSEDECDNTSQGNSVLHAPVILPLDPMLAKYLYHTPSVMTELKDEIKVDINIDEKSGSITLSQNEASSQNWPAEATEKIQFFLSNSVCKTDIYVPNEGASDVYPILIGGCTQEGLQYALGQGDSKVYVAGKTHLVNKLKSDVEELCGRMIRKVEVIKVSEEDYAYMKGISFPSIQRNFPSIQIKCVDIDHSVSAGGSLRDVALLKQNFPKYVSHSRAPVSLHPLALEFLRLGKAPDFFRSILQKTTCVSYFVKETSAQNFSLYLLCPQEKASEAENVAMKVCDSIEVQILALPKHFIASAGKKQKFKNFQENLMHKNPHHFALRDEELVLVSSSESSSSLFGDYKFFIGEECSSVETIYFKKGAWRFLQTKSAGKKWTEITEELKKMDVAIVSLSKPYVRKPFVKIKGILESVAIAKEKLSALQNSIIEQSIPIARPGVCRYFFDDPNGQMILQGVETKANVCIEMGVKEDEQNSTRSTTTGAEFVRICFGNTNEMKTINIYVGDITEFNKAEVIVNAANENLMHAGGVAQAIEAKGGAEIRQDSERYVRARGKVSTGSAVLFNRVGNLPPPYKAIVHTVGPRWYQRNEKEKSLLKKAVFSCFKEAKDYNSIAIPAISGGIYGFPSDVCAIVLMEAAKAFSEKEKHSTLNEINFVVFQDNVDTFVSAAKAVFPDIRCPGDTVSNQSIATPSKNTQGKWKRRALSITPTPVGVNTQMQQPTAAMQTSPAKKRTTPVQTSAAQNQTSYSSSVLQKIKITKGDILKNLEDVIVNPTDQKFGFSGFVAKALKKNAGPGLEEECETTNTPLQIGQVVTTGAHSLSAQYITHVVLPGYGEPNSVETLAGVLVKCFEECSRLGMKSISIPSIGAGNLQYPPDVVAKCLIGTAAEYISKHQHNSLQFVHFVIFDKDIHQEFIKTLDSLKGSGASASSSIPLTPSQSTHFQHNSFQDDDGNQPCVFSLPNSLRLEVVQDDITSACVDVVVNTTNQHLKLVGSGVASALAKKAGPSLQSACDSLVHQGVKVAEGNVVETPCANMGSLRCKSIFHIVFSKHKLEQTIFACLERAEKMKYSSIAFPAIGTGGGNMSPHTAVNAVVNALKKFTSKRSQKCLNLIQIVLFQSDHYVQFVDAFKKMEASSDGFLRRMINAVGSYFGYSDKDEEVTEYQFENEFEELEIDEQNVFANLPREAEVIITIFGESQQSVGRAEKSLRAIIDSQFMTEEFEDSNVRFLSDFNVSKLEEFAKSHQVDLEIERDFNLNSVRIHGCHNDVLVVKDKVRQVLASYTHDLVKKEAAEAMSRHIRWIRVAEGDTQEYGEVFTYEIESAFQKKQAKFVSSDDSEQFEICFKTMEETDLVTGAVLKVTRIDLMEEERPPEWEPMPTNSAGKETTIHLVTVTPDSQEFMDAEKKFNATMVKGNHYNQIHCIQRLQNPVLYSQYIARKKEMDRRNPTGHENEKWLFHGTASNVLDNINTNGFNRIFKGKNGTVFGEGVYFARDAHYSNSYARPDGNGFKFMYLTRVLTGEYTLGKQGMMLPPAKDETISQHILFDSTVNNQGSPSIFVVYYDSQNFPAYLIKYN